MGRQLRASMGRRASLPLIAALALAACGGSGESPPTGDTGRVGLNGVERAAATTQADAVRLAQQASFGPSEALVSEIQGLGVASWIDQQLAVSGSRFTSGGDDRIHTRTSQVAFCDSGKQKDNVYCWRDWYSTEPLSWDFFRNAASQPDQLRQRVAFALSHFLVVSGHEVGGTYGLRNYQNQFLDNAFGNYRDVLRKVTLSPVMGDYLDHVNNSKTAPNENFARELLQLFSLGTCKLQSDGTPTGGRCKPVYNNDMVRNYAFALTGWTYPKGGHTYWGCWPEGANCQYYGGDMTPAPKLRDSQTRRLLSGLKVPAKTDAATAVNLVIDSLMNHANIAPFVSKKLIQHLVSGDPEPAYVARVAAAFNAGSFQFTDEAGTHSYGTGQRGDLAATVAAVLLDVDARNTGPDQPRSGHLRAPVLLFTGALRAMNGHTDGGALGWWWGETLKQHVFMSPSVFGFYPPDYPVPGTSRVGPEFGIHNTNGALERLNYLTYLFDWGGSPPDDSIPNPVGTGVSLDAFVGDADQAGVLVDRLALLTLGQPLAAEPRKKVINAVSFWDKTTDAGRWRQRRVETAAYLVMASPDYQVQH